jgi:hypothetical protein
MAGDDEAGAPDDPPDVEIGEAVALPPITTPEWERGLPEFEATLLADLRGIVGDTEAAFRPEHIDALAHKLRFYENHAPPDEYWWKW